MEYDSYELAGRLVHAGLTASCIPVVNSEGEADVAVVGLEPNDLAIMALTHPSTEVRIHALLAVCYRAHELLPSEGLRWSEEPVL